MAIPPGITGSKTMEVTSLWTRNPPEEWDSAGNYKLMDEEFTEERDSSGNYQLMGAD
jgi:hypothetical protein